MLRRYLRSAGARRVVRSMEKEDMADTLSDVWTLHCEMVVIQLWLSKIDSCARQDASGSIRYMMSPGRYTRGAGGQPRRQNIMKVCANTSINSMHI